MEQDRSIDRLVLKARKYILDHGYCPIHRYTLHWVWKKFNLYTKEKQQTNYTFELGIEFFCKWLGYQSEVETTKKDEYKFRAIKMLDDIFHDRPLKRKYSHKPVYIPTGLISELNAYLKRLSDKGQKQSTIAGKSSRLLVFLRFLDSNRIELSALDFQAVESFYRHISTIYNRTSQANIKYTIRDFLQFCATSGYAPSGSDSLVGTIYSNKHERLPSTYTVDELNKVLHAINRSTAYGKRDYALIVLMVHLGMRSSDICNLSLDSINLEDRTINFIQQKTGSAERLPLTQAVELALADYIVNVRNDAPSDRLFVSHCGINRGRSYSTGVLYTILNKYMQKACIRIEGKRHGPHSVRHSLSSNLLKCGTPLPVISSILGHSSTEVTNRYIWMDTEQLRRLSLEVRYESKN